MLLLRQGHFGSAQAVALTSLPLVRGVPYQWRCCRKATNTVLGELIEGAVSHRSEEYRRRVGDDRSSGLDGSFEKGKASNGGFRWSGELGLLFVRRWLSPAWRAARGWFCRRTRGVNGISTVRPSLNCEAFERIEKARATTCLGRVTWTTSPTWIKLWWSLLAMVMCFLQRFSFLDGGKDFVSWLRKRRLLKREGEEVEIREGEMFKVEQTPFFYTQVPCHFQEDPPNKRLNHTGFMEQTLHFWRNCSSFLAAVDNVDSEAPEEMDAAQPGWTSMMSNLPRFVLEERI